MNRALRFLCVAGVVAADLLGTGCLPYVYPKLDYVPRQDLTAKDTNVHAFRVDVTADVALVMGESGPFTLTEITPQPDGSVPPQTRVTVEYGSLCLMYLLGHRHQTRVRLYRPGYRLVERRAWEPADAIFWEAATDWTAQEKAIDDLVTCPVVAAEAGRRDRDRPPASASPAATRACLYIASEYERVAKLATTPKDAERLQSKARAIRESISAAPPSSAPASASP